MIEGINLLSMVPSGASGKQVSSFQGGSTLNGDVNGFNSSIGK